MPRRRWGAGTQRRAAAARLKEDQTVLDVVRDDVGRLNTRLAAGEKMKMDQYLTSIRDLENKLKLLSTAGAGCGKPAPPAPAVNQGAAKGEAVTPERMTALLDMVATAFMCNLTHVATIAGGQQNLPFLASGATWAPVVGMHQMWHEAGTYPECSLGGRGRRHGQEERSVITALVEEAVAAGARLESACKELGIDARTIQRWGAALYMRGFFRDVSYVSSFSLELRSRVREVSDVEAADRAKKN